MPPRTACGPAVVRRDVRVGTGRRLSCALGGMADALARGASSREGSPGSSPGGRTQCLRVRRPAAPCKNGSRGQHSAEARIGQLLCRQGPPGLEPGLATLVRVQSGQIMPA